ncbi:Unknown protein [Striga hermonthica]|uniref:Uncharacterized protein n=1 Tax=Striga hermonthica TaxID=68872 RepID=A0A9N7RPF6_STRHE|nr:Unknown protein [Striga hermonthica]
MSPSSSSSPSTEPSSPSSSPPSSTELWDFRYGVFYCRDDGDDAASPATTVRDAHLHLHRMAFAKLLELPFRCDADVSIEETLGSLRFIIAADDLGNVVCAFRDEGSVAVQIKGDLL